MISKILHTTWTIGSAMPELHLVTLKSFHKYNPDWQIKMYITENKILDTGYLETDYFSEVAELGYVEMIYTSFGIPDDVPPILTSDIIRRIVLYAEGGVYSDMDVIWLRSMDEFLKDKDFDTMVCIHPKGFHNVSILISEQGSDMDIAVINAGRRLTAPYQYQAFGTDLVNAMYPTLKDVMAKHPRTLSVPYETFYPYSTLNLKPLYKNTDLSYIKDAVCIHWFCGNKLSKEYIQSNYPPCSMTEILKKEGWLQ
jgi:hypothetical protein